MSISKIHPTFCKTVAVWCRYFICSIAAKITVAQIVGQNNYYIWQMCLSTLCRKAKSQSHGGKWQSHSDFPSMESSELVIPQKSPGHLWNVLSEHVVKALI